jgi:glycosyltransferase involved in cell wall biosynthesis
VPSPFLHRIVLGWAVPEGLCTIIYNAVTGGARSPVRSGTNTTFRALTVGRLVAWKGVDWIIQALPLVHKISLTVAGDGPSVMRCVRSPRE